MQPLQGSAADDVRGSAVQVEPLLPPVRSRRRRGTRRAVLRRGRGRYMAADDSGCGSVLVVHAGEGARTEELVRGARRCRAAPPDCISVSAWRPVPTPPPVDPLTARPCRDGAPAELCGRAAAGARRAPTRATLRAPVHAPLRGGADNGAGCLGNAQVVHRHEVLHRDSGHPRAPVPPPARAEARAPERSERPQHALSDSALPAAPRVQLVDVLGADVAAAPSERSQALILVCGSETEARHGLLRRSAAPAAASPHTHTPEYAAGGGCRDVGARRSVRLVRAAR